MATSEHDRRLRETYPGEPLSEEAYHREVERLLGPCGCGGEFSFDAPVRCPRCRSTAIKEGRPSKHYD
jgi:hypothetical protein